MAPGDGKAKLKKVVILENTSQPSYTLLMMSDVHFLVFHGFYDTRSVLGSRKRS